MGEVTDLLGVPPEPWSLTSTSAFAYEYIQHISDTCSQASCHVLVTAHLEQSTQQTPNNKQSGCLSI